MFKTMKTQSGTFLLAVVVVAALAVMDLVEADCSGMVEFSRLKGIKMPGKTGSERGEGMIMMPFDIAYAADSEVNRRLVMTFSRKVKTISPTNGETDAAKCKGRRCEFIIKKLGTKEGYGGRIEIDPSIIFTINFEETEHQNDLDVVSAKLYKLNVVDKKGEDLCA